MGSGAAHIGRAVLPGVDVALVDESGTPVDVGDEGEIVVRSPGVFLGYLDDQETTDSVLSEDGWLWTGDVGIFDDDGYLYLVDRIKDIVIVSGFNVYPAEVENVLMHHPGVSGAIVTGTPTRRPAKPSWRTSREPPHVKSWSDTATSSSAGTNDPPNITSSMNCRSPPNGKAIRRALR